MKKKRSITATGGIKNGIPYGSIKYSQTETEDTKRKSKRRTGRLGRSRP